MGTVRIAVVPGPGPEPWPGPWLSGLLCELNDDGSKGGDAVSVPSLAEAIAEREREPGVRWVWPATVGLYPELLAAGIRVARCHDVALTDALIATRDGSPLPGDARERLRPLQSHSQPFPAPGPGAPGGPGGPAGLQESLFAPGDADAARSKLDPRDLLEALIEVHAEQLARLAADEHPGKFSLLAAAESAGGLAAAEMSVAGLPWRSEVHDELLTDLLGPRPAGGAPPPRLAELITQISAALPTGRPVNPDSPAQVLQALAKDGIRLPSTRLTVLRDVDHPAIPPLIEYKELARLHSAFGWSWLDTWVRDGRFRPEYMVGGVVSGRWASRGGGALQIPRMLRRAVVADPGWVLVVADAAQLEPRVLAALAGDRAFAAAAATGDLYAELAGAFGGDRAKAKVALLSAMYGGAGGEAGQLLAVLRQRFPAASGYVEAAARAGEEGRVVRSVLGRTCPPPSARWRELTEEAGEPGAGSASRARGRFTRNFVVQASAADWALVLLANLRTRLAESPARLVFFQHDEVIVHTPEELADQVVAETAAAANDAARQVFGRTRVVFPLTTAVVNCYGDAK
jgi:hypothetical protein